MKWFRRLKEKIGRLRDASAGHRSAEAALVAYLAEQISVPGKAASVLKAKDRFQQLTPAEKGEELPALYLLLEQYLTEIDPVRQFKRKQLRQRVCERFPELQEHADFRLIFEPPARQKVLLCRAFLLAALHQTRTILGATGDNLLGTLRDWIDAVPDRAAPPPPMELAEKMPSTDEDWTPLLIRLAQKFYLRLETQLGKAAERIYEKAYHHTARRYLRLETFPVVIGLLPEELLDDSKMQLLSHSYQLQARDRKLEETQGALVAARTAALDSAAQLQAVLNTVGEGIITIDTQGTIVLANQEAGNIWGYAHEELIGHHLTRLIPASEWPDKLGVNAGDMEAYISHILGVRIELEGLQQDGRTFPLEMRIQETHIGEQLLFTAAVRDITVRKRFETELIAAKEQAEEMARLKSAFLTNVSHEIRTPITAILGFSEILSEEVKSEHLEFTESINRSGKRLLHTLNAILDLSKLESDAMEMYIETVDVSGAVRDVVKRFAPAAAERGVVLRSELPDDEIEALLDRAAVHRVLDNLVDNAVKFTEEGEVVVSIDPFQGGTCLMVRDTGVGISETFVPHLFDAFKQESTGLTRSYEGTGLGLAVTRRLVEALGGTITVESRQGEGTTFTVVFSSTASAGVEALEYSEDRG